MSHDTQAFRARYRAGIHPRYNPWLHGGFVLAFGIAVLWLCWREVTQVRPPEWLALPLALLFMNAGIYVVHRHLGHHKHGFSRLFYQRHSGDHHSFFANGLMDYDSARDWRVILFPAWLIVLFSLAFVLPAWAVLSLFNANVAGLFAGGMVTGYLLYEIFHACEHLPARHPLARLPWLRQMRHLHALHHRRDLMQARNFNIVLPLTDWLCGTLHHEPEPFRPAAGETRER